MRKFIVRNGAITLLYSSLLLVLICVLTVSTGYAANGGGQDVRFAVIGDYGNASNGADDLADLVYSWGTDFILTVGDNRYGTRTFDETVGQFYCSFLSDAEIGTFCDGGSSVRNDFYPSTGNHDYSDLGDPSEYLNYFTLPGIHDVSSWTSGSELYYDFIRGPVHFFVLDSQGALNNALDETAQKNWLENALAQSTSPWQIVYFHHAPYASGIHGSTTSMRWPFADWGADAVISGHDHIYERIHANGITYFISGLGGTSAYDIDTPLPVSQASYNSEYGALLVDASDDDISFQFINTSGAVIDTHTISEPSSPGVIDVWIENSLDDVEQRVPEGTMNVVSSDIELGDDPIGDQAEGLRFRNLNIPQGASILEAYLEFVVDETKDDASLVEIRAQDIGDAPEFSTIDFDLTDRITTSNFVTWPIPVWDVVREIHQSPDLAILIQEVVDRSDWQADNSIAFIITGTGTRTAHSWDGNQGFAPLLHVEFSTSMPTSIENILTEFDDAVAAGTITGQGKKHKKHKKHKKSKKQLKSMRKLLTEAGKSIKKDKTRKACSKLKHADKSSDGLKKPRDLVVGEAVPELNSMIKELMFNLGCK